MLFTPLLDRISRSTAFFPPDPPTYKLDRHGDGAQELFIQPVVSGIKKVPRAQVALIPVESKENIVAAFIPAPKSSHKTLLYSHGNAVDLGLMLPNLEMLGKTLGVNVASYDYRGYGCSEGVPSMSACLRDISAVVKWLQKEHRKSLSDIVLLGQSIGSGPSSWFAAKNPGLAGVILQSAFLSGIQVLNPSLKRWPGWLDVFPNKNFVPKISCRTLIIHGTSDMVIDVSHGKKLHLLCRCPSQPLWAAGKGHEDVEAHEQYVPTLQRFMTEVFVSSSS